MILNNKTKGIGSKVTAWMGGPPKSNVMTWRGGRLKPLQKSDVIHEHPLITLQQYEIINKTAYVESSPEPSFLSDLQSIRYRACSLWISICSKVPTPLSSNRANVTDWSTVASGAIVLRSIFIQFSNIAAHRFVMIYFVDLPWFYSGRNLAPDASGPLFF